MNIDHHLCWRRICLFPKYLTECVRKNPPFPCIAYVPLVLSFKYRCVYCNKCNKWFQHLNAYLFYFKCTVSKLTTLNTANCCQPFLPILSSCTAHKDWMCALKDVQGHFVIQPDLCSWTQQQAGWGTWSLDWWGAWCSGVTRPPAPSLPGTGS